MQGELPQPATSAPQRQKRRSLVVVASAVLVCFSIVLATCLFYIKQKTTEVKTPLPLSQAHQLIAEVKDALAKRYDLIDPGPDPKEDQATVTLGDQSPDYLESRGNEIYNRYGLPDGDGASLTIAPYTNSKKVDEAQRDDAYQIITNSFTSEGLTEITNTQIYTNSVLICYAWRHDINSITASCINRDNYERAYQQIKPIVDAAKTAYAETLQDETVFMALGKPIIRKPVGLNAGYEIATLGIDFSDWLSGAVAEFYRESDGEWIYSHSGHDMPNCKEFDQTEARNAFYYHQCRYDYGTTTVGSYYLSM